jgi:alkylhydroperoxidase/carboxymuconolactone decarboxylase family protein YurZ
MMDVKELEQLLRETGRRRGYLLPHHGLMAVALPGMLEDYDRLYASVATTARELDEHAREFVWLAVLAARDEALGTHHVARFRAAGGTAGQVGDALAIAAIARGAGAYAFAERHWAAHLPDLDAPQRFAEVLRGAARATPASLGAMAASAALACVGAWSAFRWQLAEAYALGVDERQLAEALSLMLLPGSVPNFARAAAEWRDLIRAGQIEASAAFSAWAALEGQGGYDEAAGVSKAPGD